MKLNSLSIVHRSVVSAAKASARQLGIAIKRYRNELDDENVLRQLLQEVTIDLVVDVGANIGQFANLLRRCGYQGMIVSFEPLLNAHRNLVDASRCDPLWKVAERVALGAASGLTEINVAGNSASSSLLPMLESHVDAAPHSDYVGTEAIAIERLDAVLPKMLIEARHGLLKIDTQGYEDRVLEGATGVIGGFAAVQVEISLKPLYAGQASGARLFKLLDSYGFELQFVIPGFRDAKSGRLLQFDGIFVRRK